MNNIVDKYISSAKRITSIISILTFTTMFLFLFTHPSQKNELKLKEKEKKTLDSLIIRSDSVFFEIRTFYEGSVEDTNYTFAFFINALSESDSQLSLIREIINLNSLTEKDKLFFNHKYYSLKDNIHGLRTIIDDIIEQKKKRVPFDKLTLSDLSDLDYHKGKDPWYYSRSVNSLKMALIIPGSPGYQSGTKGITGLENRYNYYKSKKQGSSNNTKPLISDTNKTKKVTSLLDELELKDYKTLYQLKSEINSIEEEIKKSENEIKVSLSLPIINISIKYSSMTWLIPITLMILLILLNFYLGKINLAFKSISQKNENIELISVPWFFIEDDNLSKRILIPANILKIAILFSVIFAEIIPLIIATNLNFSEYFFPVVFIVASIWFLYSTFKELNKIKKAYNNKYM